VLPDLSKSVVLCALVAVTASVSLDRSAAAEMSGPLASAKSGTDYTRCEVIAPPARRVETASKYDQTIASKSVIDSSAAAARNAVMRPIDDAVRRLQAMARTASTDPEAIDRCVAQTMRRWAEAGSLTDMASADANLTRDRVVAAISEVLVSARARGTDVASDEGVRDWLSSIASQTMHFYDWKAGQNSRRNNHRYWAGLSVGRIGYLLGDAQMTAWAGNSLEIGLCQIDEQGFLPLELQRGAKAFDYHLYAYIALRSLSDLLQSSPTAGTAGCRERLARLGNRVSSGIAAFETRTGLRQDDPARKNLMAAARLAANPQAAGSTSIGVNY
jgi:hypothetical protein